MGCAASVQALPETKKLLLKNQSAYQTETNTAHPNPSSSQKEESARSEQDLPKSKALQSSNTGKRSNSSYKVKHHKEEIDHYSEHQSAEFSSAPVSEHQDQSTLRRLSVSQTGTRGRVQYVPPIAKLDVVNVHKMDLASVNTSGSSIDGGKMKHSAAGEFSVRKFLEEHVLFKNLDENFLNALTNEMQIRVYNDKDYIIRKGEVGRAMFFIARGEVTVVSEDGETVINIMKEQSFFGEIGVLFSVPRTASCRARGRCVILTLTKEKLQKAVEPYPQVADAIALIAEERFTGYMRQTEQATDMDFGEELHLGMTKDDLGKIPLFRDCEVGFLHMLALKLRPVQFRQHELIIKKGDIAQELYFVVRGVAEVFGEEDGKVYAQFQPGSFFGEVGLLHEVKRTASVRAVTSVINVFRLTKEDLDEVLKEYPEINEKIKEEARQRFRFNELREKAKLEKDTAVQTELEVVREMLKNVPLFKNGPVGFLHELALSLKLNSAKPDDEIIKKGDIGQSMFFVMEGIADVTSEDGKVLYAEIPSNSFFGEVALFYDVPRTASVRARTRCTLFELSKDALHHVLSHNADLKSAMEVTAAENFKLFQSRQAAVEKIGKRSEAKSTEAFSVEVITDRLKKVPIFSHCDDGFLRTLALTTSIHVFKLGDLVVRKGDTSSSEMYFIVTGSVEIVSEDGEDVYDMVKEGGFFGEVALLRGISRTASVRVSSSVCDTVALSASNLEAVLREYPEAYQSVSLEAEKRYQLTEQRRRQDERKSTGSKMSLSKLTNIRSFFTKSRSGSRDNTLERKKKKDIVEDDVKAKEKNDERVSSVGHDDSLTERGKIGKMLTSIKKSLKVRRESKVGGGRLSSVSTFGGTPSPSIRAIARITHVLELMEDDLAIVFAFIDPLTRAKLRLVCRKWNRQLANQRHWVLNDFSSVYKQTTPKVIKVVSAFISEQLALVNLCSCFQLYDDDILTLVSNCTNIASLGLSNCWKLTDRGLSYAAQYLPQLQALDISYCGQMTGSGFADHRWSTMRRVDLTYCKQIGDEQLEKLLSRTTDIDELRLRRCTRITDFGVFLVVRYCRYLQSLDLSDCDQIPDKCLKWIAGSCFNLIHLNLTFCTRLTNGGLYNLSLGAQHFDSMNLSYCSHLTDAAIMFFGDHAKSFRRLSFRRCPKMTDKVVQFLSRSSPLLEHLDVTGCPNISKGSVALIHGTIGPHVRVLMDAPIPQFNRTKPIATEAPIEEVFTSVPRSMRSPRVAPAGGKHKRRGSRDRGGHKKLAAAGSSK